MNAPRTTTDWREYALELANVAAELVTVAESVSTGGWDIPPLVRGMLNTNAAVVAEVLERVREVAK